MLGCFSSLQTCMSDNNDFEDRVSYDYDKVPTTYDHNPDPLIGTSGKTEYFHSNDLCLPRGRWVVIGLDYMPKAAGGTFPIRDRCDA